MTNSSSNSLSLLSAVFAAIAFFLSWSSAFNCNYVSFTTAQDTNLSLGFGLWSHSWYAISVPLNGSYIFQACIGYGSSVAIDGPMKAARVFAILALTLGGVIFFSSLISGCVHNPNTNNNDIKRTRSEGVAYLFACLFQGLSLLLLNSPTICTNNQLIHQLQSDMEGRTSSSNIPIEFSTTCSISTGARCCIAAIVFWFMAALVSCQATSVARKEEEINGRKENLREPLVPNDIL
ncbi:hypothetical protein ACHAXM_000981 [Skeletonema potamos]